LLIDATALAKLTYTMFHNFFLVEIVSTTYDLIIKCLFLSGKKPGETYLKLRFFG